MSLSKIVKGGIEEELQPIHFGEFSADGAGGGVFLTGTPLPESSFVGDAEEAPAPEEAPPVEQLVEEAYAKGRQEGRAEAAEELEQQFGQPLQAFVAAAEEIGRLRESILKSSTDDMLRLVMAIAEQVIACEIQTNPEIIHHTIQRALQAAVASDEYHIKVHPDDFAVVTEKKPLLLASISGLKNITLEVEPSLTRGGCLVESELGEVDATIESQLEELRQRTLAAGEGG